MFTPQSVAGGLAREKKLNKSRVTTEIFVVSGEKFVIEDQHTEPRAAHLMLEHA